MLYQLIPVLINYSIISNYATSIDNNINIMTLLGR